MDWIDEYFKRDLTESEEAELDQQLSASPEDARRMAEGMAELYRQSGLPEPLWPEKPFLGGKSQESKKSSKTVFYYVLILLLAGALAIFWGSSLHWRIPAFINPPPKPHGYSTPTQKSRLPAKPLHVKQNQAGPSQAVSAVPRPSTRPAPAKTGGRYEELSVTVNLQGSGLVTVHVLDGGGNVLRTLYAGILPAGQRVFTWDGVTDRGILALPGAYYIEVKSGSKILKREVHVEPGP